MSRFYLHDACQPFCCGRCGDPIDATDQVVTRDELDICSGCDERLDDELSSTCAATALEQSPETGYLPHDA
jgi:hypothetical protein